MSKVAPITELVPPASEIERVAFLYRQVPSMVAASLLGVFLCFVFLFEAIGGSALKGWAAFMLSGLAVRAWLWQAHRNSEQTAASARRWEYLGAFGALLTGCGWGLLAGPLYPINDPVASDFVVLMLVAVAFSSVSFNSMSFLTFFAIVIPTLAPLAINAFHGTQSFFDTQSLIWLALVGVLLVLQRSQYALIMENVSRRVESEALLEEQKAIFQSASQGIAVVSGANIVKCNQRLGEMLGRRLQDLYSLGFDEHCVDHNEYRRLLADSQEAFLHDRNYHGMVRLLRADGSSFWAEISARRMHGEDNMRSVWLIGEAPVKHGAHGPRS